MCYCRRVLPSSHRTRGVFFSRLESYIHPQMAQRELPCYYRARCRMDRRQKAVVGCVWGSSEAFTDSIDPHQSLMHGTGIELRSWTASLLASSSSLIPFYLISLFSPSVPLVPFRRKFSSFFSLFFFFFLLPLFLFHIVINKIHPVSKGNKSSISSAAFSINPRLPSRV